jgi:uridine kinase
VRDAARAVAELVEPGMRVAVDGVSASGKTTFANALAELVPGAARATLDDFLAPPPRTVYYPHAFDFPRFRAHVESLEGTAIVDGLFLHHLHLRDLWSLTVFLRCDQAVAMERGIERDASWMENARERYATRYVPEEGRYLAEVDPASLADVVVDTTDLDAPRLELRPRRTA